MSDRNFPITRDGQAIAVAAGANVAVAIDGDSAFVAAALDVLIDNRGDADFYVRAGGASVAATVNSVRVPAGQGVIFGKGSATHLAFYGAGASQAVVHLGAGG